MTNRERLLAIMDGKSPDRIPWIPRLLVWHTAHTNQGSLPERYRDRSLRELERSLGMGTPARDGRVFRTQQKGDVEISTAPDGESTVTTYRTPAGTVTTRSRGSDELRRAGIGNLEIEHMIKGPDDFAAVEYLIQHLEYQPAYKEYQAYDAEIGEDGYPMVNAGDCPFHYFLQKLAGYQAGYYLLADCPGKVEHLMGLLEEIDRERVWPLVADSPAGLILHGLHLDSEITPPPMFERYITPYYKAFTELLHAKGKKLCMHADNDSRLILHHLEDAGYDMVETFTTAPQVTCTLAEAREAWGTRMVIWGGLPSVLLEPTYTDAAFEEYMRDLLRTIAPGDAFVLGVADNVMPAALPHRLERVGEMLDQWGSYPIDPASIP